MWTLRAIGLHNWLFNCLAPGLRNWLLDWLAGHQQRDQIAMLSRNWLVVAGLKRVVAQAGTGWNSLCNWLRHGLELGLENLLWNWLPIGLRCAAAGHRVFGICQF